MFRHRFIRFVLYTSVCILTYGCHVVPNEIKAAERLMDKAPDTALQVLQHLPAVQYTSGSDRALYGLLLARALDKNLLPIKPDTLLDFSVRYYLSRHDHPRLAACLLYKGRMYHSIHRYETAMCFYLKGLDAALIAEDDVLLGEFNFDMALINAVQGDYAPAREKYRRAYAFFIHAGLQPQAFYSLLNIGKTYRAACRYKYAHQYYRSLPVPAKDSLQQGAFLQEVGLNFYKSHQVDSALFYFRQAIHYPTIGNNRAMRYMHLADLYFDLNRPECACYYAKKAFCYQPDIRTQQECYRVLMNCAAVNGYPKALYHTLKNYQRCTDSIHKIDAQTRGSVLESIHNLNKEVSATKNKGRAVIAFLILVILAGGLFFFRRIHRQRIDTSRLEESHRELKVSVRKELMLEHLEALHQLMEEAKSKQSAERKKASFADKERMDRKLYDDFLHMNDIDFFYREMDIRLNHMVTKLRTRHPALTYKEICWCCLHLLRVPTNDIYLLLDYKVDSFIKMKQRLAQKIGVSGVIQLYEFLNDTIAE